MEWQTLRMSDYRKLKVWQKAHALVLSSHRTATRIRGQDHVALRSQVIRSAMSVPANIVEGREQRSEAAFGRFLQIALASVSELEYHLIAARDIKAITGSDYLSLSSQVEAVRMMLHGLIQRLKSSKEAGEKQ